MGTEHGKREGQTVVSSGELQSRFIDRFLVAGFGSSDYIALGDFNDYLIAQTDASNDGVIRRLLVMERINSSKIRIPGYRDSNSYLEDLVRRFTLSFKHEKNASDEFAIKLAHSTIRLIWEQTLARQARLERSEDLFRNLF